MKKTTAILLFSALVSGGAFAATPSFDNLFSGGNSSLENLSDEDFDALKEEALNGEEAKEDAKYFAEYKKNYEKVKESVLDAVADDNSAILDDANIAKFVTIEHLKVTRHNSQKIQQNANKISSLDQKLKRGLATQAALNGLFQPYNVGKMNLSVAVGGYESQSALAIGSGYRFNDKLAVKMGVAFSVNGGGTAYNVGANYEF